MTSVSVFFSSEATNKDDKSVLSIYLPEGPIVGKVHRAEIPLQGRGSPSCPLVLLSFARLHNIGNIDGAFRRARVPPSLPL